MKGIIRIFKKPSSKMHSEEILKAWQNYNLYTLEKTILIQVIALRLYLLHEPNQQQPTAGRPFNSRHSIFTDSPDL